MTIRLSTRNNESPRFLVCPLSHFICASARTFTNIESNFDPSYMPTIRGWIHYWQTAANCFQSWPSALTRRRFKVLSLSLARHGGKSDLDSRYAVAINHQKSNGLVVTPARSRFAPRCGGICLALRLVASVLFRISMNLHASIAFLVLRPASGDSFN